MVIGISEENNALLEGAHPFKQQVLFPPSSVYTRRLEVPKCASQWSSKRPGKKVLPKILCLHFTSLSLLSKKDQIHKRQAMQFQEFPTCDIQNQK